MQLSNAGTDILKLTLLTKWRPGTHKNVLFVSSLRYEFSIFFPKTLGFVKNSKDTTTTISKFALFRK